MNKNTEINKSATARANGTKGGRPGMYSVVATEKGYEVGPSVSLAYRVARPIAIQAARKAVADGYEGVFIHFFRSRDGLHGHLNPSGNCETTGKCWDNENLA